MTNKPVSYTNRELGMLLIEIKDQLSSFVITNAKDHDELKTQVKRTNGRVRSLEIWRSFILGGIGVLGFIMPFVIYKILK